MIGEVQILLPLMIFCLRIIDVSMGTIRIIMVMKGKRWLAAFIGFLEVTIFVIALGTVVANLDNIANILAYSLGFAGGTLLGSLIEEKIALGFMSVQVIPSQGGSEIIRALRDNGFGVTSLEGWGRDGPRIVIVTHFFRRDWKKIKAIIDGIDERAFITVMDTRSTKGGHLRLLKKK